MCNTRNLALWTYRKNILVTPRDLASAKEMDPSAPVGMPQFLASRAALCFMNAVNL
jgi:hypothetical protein